MPQIITSSKFTKANELNIPQAEAFITENPAIETPNGKAFIDELCIKTEKELLINALGLATYNALQLALADIDTPDNAKYKKLVQGDEYNNKIWIGLNSDYSCIVYRVLELYLSSANKLLTGVGLVNANPEKSNLISPKIEIANANAKFIQGYQAGFLQYPEISCDGLFIDWYGTDQQNSNFVSLYQYLLDHPTDFSVDNFKGYGRETQNSFGI